MESIENLKAWQWAMELVVEIYKVTKKFPKEEQYGLTAQMRRAAVSIIGNIAEGFGRFTFADKANKYTIAKGECEELKTYLLVSIRLGIVSQKDAQRALRLESETAKVLSGLISSSKNRSKFPDFQHANTPNTSQSLIL